MSLPRSYTLPREFKFNREGRKIIKNEHFVASTNSSDGKRFIVLKSFISLISKFKFTIFIAHKHFYSRRRRRQLWW